MKKTIIISGVGGTIVLAVSAVLKILHLPYSGILFTLGALFLAILFLPLAVTLFREEGKTASLKFMFLVITTIGLIMLFALLHLRIQNVYEAGFYDHQYRQETLLIYQRDRNSAEAMVHQYMLSYRDINEVHRRTSDIMAAVTGLESEMVLNPGTRYREELDKALESYELFLESVLGTEGMEIIGPLLDHSSFLPSGKTETGSIALMPALHSLTVLKNRILLAEIASVKILSIPQESE